MRDFIRNPKNWMALCVVLAVLFALIYSFLSSTNANLPSYVEPPATPAEQTPAVDIETVQFAAEGINLTMSAPAKWTHVIRQGADAYINPADGATLFFHISGYDPGVNMVTEEIIASELSASGGLLGGFSRNGNSAYLAIYEQGAVDCFEYTTWDLSTLVRISLQVPAERYTDYYDTAIFLFDTLKWEKENPIPEGFSLFYSSYGNFEFGVLDGWNAAIDNGAYIATAASGSCLTASVTQSGLDLSSLSQLDYVGAASQGKQNYLLSTYSNAGSTLIAEATYTKDGETWVNVNNILATGSYLYEFSFDCKQSEYETDGPSFLTAMKLFRVF
ncbi:hypothetical protein MCJ35_10815 [Enterocloster sp. OA13]|uniref:hypothetical protein n=1 Tax=Enterocloster sp. OA13 TaxID=2914161 RepID=UPI0012DD4BFF|nr:hypothetical protein [Enterocloster sp. OA13]